MKKIFNVLPILIGFIGLAQQSEVVDFIKIEAQIEPISSREMVKGTVSCTFHVLKKSDSIYLDGMNMHLVDLYTDNNISITSKEKKIWLVSNFEVNQNYKVTFSYEVYPKQSLYFIGDQIWTQGQGKYTSHWLPSIDDMNDKIEFDLTILAPSGKEVIANGKLISVKDRGILKSWKFNMEHPMSSYLVAFAVGKFDSISFDSNYGIPIELYYRSKDSLKAEPTYRYTKRIFDFLEKEIGFPYPWQNYKQVPLRDFLYAGMENTTATFFSEAFIVDSIGFVDRNYVNVNAHELAHQWFGNLITETSGTHHWLHEGFATYYALLAEKDIFGDDYFYWKLFQSAEQLKALSDEGKGEILLDPKASSLTYYEKGAWALHILKEKVGATNFNKAIINYLNKYQFKNVNTDDFLNEVEKVYGKKLTQFKSDWLEQSAFKAEAAYQSLINSSFINNYFEISAMRSLPINDKKQKLIEHLMIQNDFIGQEVIYQLENEPISETLPLYKKAFQSNNVFIRQAISLSLSTIPPELKIEYESLLKDDSYLTQEAALYNLWVNFPEERSKYLEALDSIQGFQNKNIRQLWLALSIVTDDIKQDKKEEFLFELRSYTGPEFSFEIRELAFEIINSLEVWNSTSLLNLVNSCTHHYWKFKKSSRAILNNLIDDDIYLEQLKSLGKELDIKSSEFLNKLITK